MENGNTWKHNVVYQADSRLTIDTTIIHVSDLEEDAVFQILLFYRLLSSKHVPVEFENLMSLSL